jgi:hypothetical protein
MKTDGQFSFERKRARDILESDLARPARSHADQIAELRAAIANTHPTRRCSGCCCGRAKPRSRRAG